MRTKYTHCTNSVNVMGISFFVSARVEAVSMQIAVFSDIHGNHAAFEQCVKYALTNNINSFIFLGDYLGEFPYPQKTMEMIYSLKEKYICYFIRGNKEDYWISRRNNHNCEWKNGNQTVGAMKYCYENLTEKDINFFQSLPIFQEIKFENISTIMACHGSPNRNNEKMLPANENTNHIIDECACKYILYGHTHIQGAINHDNKIALNPGAVGVSLHSGGKAQFMILQQKAQEWTHEFISIDYDKEIIIKELQESGLEKAAPYWTQITKHLILTGEVSHGTVLSEAIKLCEEETGKASWCNISPKYWEKAIAELLT